MSAEHGITVVIPAFNAGEDLNRCLTALRRFNGPDLKIIVVDDCSTELSTRAIVEQHGARYLKTEENSGPSAARNLGVQYSEGDLLMFVDADVEVGADAVRLAEQTLRSDEGYSAVFGSYDDQPGHPSFLSQYRNLYHHWVHQSASDEASTFWTGCGAIKKNVFLELGAFSKAFRRPEIEDIELGYRMREAGHRIRLHKNMLCSHRKKWTLGNMVRTDIFYRGAPWMELLLKDKDRPHDLNIDNHSRIATAAAAFMGAAVLLVIWNWKLALAAMLICLIIIIAMRWGFIDFTRRKRGTWFAMRVIPAQALFFACCAAAVPIGAWRAYVSNRC